jgi:hypothetical protein
MSNGVPFTHEVPDVPRVVDKLAVGDGRNAYAALDLIQQIADGEDPHALDFKTASEKAAAFASFTLMYPGRGWIKDLGQFHPSRPSESVPLHAPEPTSY